MLFRSHEHKLQFHHIFPKAVLKAKGIDHRDIDDIANLCFISGKMNRHISDKAPSQYIPGIVLKSGGAEFEAQCIPTDPALLGPDDYNKFRLKRRELITAALNSYLQTTGTQAATATLPPNGS